MRILFVCNLFQPEPNHLKGMKFARALQANGHRVTVLTGFPNYPGGRIYDGYRVRWTTRETIDGIDIVRVAMYPSHDRSALKRSLNFLSLGLSMAAHVPFVGPRYDVSYVYYGPITLGWPAILLKWFYRTRFISDVQDIWPESVAGSGMLRRWLPLSIVTWLTNWTYRRSDAFIVLSDGYRRALTERGLSQSRIHVVRNWADEANGPTAEPVDTFLQTGAFNVVYTGNIGPLQNLRSVIEAAHLLQQRGSRCHISLVGGGVESEQLANEIHKRGLRNIELHGRVSGSCAHAIQQRADVLLLHLAESELTRIGIPQKVQSYMYAGKPILAAVEGDAADLVAEANCGLVCAPSSPSAIADAIQQLESMEPGCLAEMGRNGKRFYERELAFEAGVSRICAILEAVGARAD